MRLLLVVLAFLALWANSLAMYAVTYRDVDVDGFVCDGPGKAIVFYPSNGARQELFPLISFVHGYNSGGNDSRLTRWYGALLSNISAYGFVIVAPLTSVTTECSRFSEDQLTALQANFQANRIPADTSRVAVMGQSAGGLPAIQSASKMGYNIRAAVILHPAGGSPKEASKIKVPVMFGTGSKDPVAPSWNVWKMYQATHMADKTFGVLKGADHGEAAGGGSGGLGGHDIAGRWPRWVGAFLRCHLSEDPAACDFFYGHFCRGDIDKFTWCRVPTRDGSILEVGGPEENAGAILRV